MTISMIRILDYRAMSREDSSLALSNPVSNVTAHVNRLSHSLPNLRCLVLDGRADYNMKSLKTLLNSTTDSTREPLKKIALLSLRGHPQLGSPEIFLQQALGGLVYLDLSYTRGWAHDLQHARGFVQENLPNLRVLKLGHMALDSRTVVRLLFDFPHQFWSLNISGNKLKDDVIHALHRLGVRCDVNRRLQHDSHFEVEGKLRRSDIADSIYFVDETESSANFSHPLRYFADPPNYNAENEDEHRSQPFESHRLVGTERIRGDAVDDAITVLAGGAHDPVPMTTEWPSRVPSLGGLTHLHMNGLQVSLKRLQSLLGDSSGCLEHFECDQALFSLSSQFERRDWLSKAPWLSTGTQLSGFFGSAYLFRPVISSNLRVLKIHHSLVTNVPSVISKSTSALENIWVAEKLFLDPIDLAYPQTYVPDMNPRLYSLTLAHIPRFSPGVIAKRIINFLKLLAAQERAIEQTKKLTPLRGPLVLRGLRHICLEFEPDAHQQMTDLNTEDDVDAALDEFSTFSFSDNAWDEDTAVTPIESINQPRRQSSSMKSISSSHLSAASPGPPTVQQQQPIPTTPDGRFDVFPYTTTKTESLPFALTSEQNLNVWIGNGTPNSPSNTPAVNAYMRALTLSNGRFARTAASSSSIGSSISIIPATPCHVAAGAPAGSYLFGDAWHHLALPDKTIKRPTKAELAEGMRDVLKEIKEFRLASREVYARLTAAAAAAVVVQNGEEEVAVGQHEYWKGRVEISLVEPKNEFDVMYGQ